ncbi:hypothetical protein DPMN_070327 [Dreissena polymorpha]|uniref:Uncharacterized protein n=1 Tax=Dreissena polymorpha TaxID=45954 RepID=A0A9D3Z5S1_DREPO|nr:hypothetical protein DPMN_070327 [Dreissena polymorpha]
MLPTCKISLKAHTLLRVGSIATPAAVERFHARFATLENGAVATGVRVVVARYLAVHPLRALAMSVPDHVVVEWQTGAQALTPRALADVQALTAAAQSGNTRNKALVKMAMSKQRKTRTVC